MFVVPKDLVDEFGEKLTSSTGGLLDFAEVVDDLTEHLPRDIVCCGIGYDGVLFHKDRGAKKFEFEDLAKFNPSKDLRPGDTVGLHVSSNLIFVVNNVERVATDVLGFLELENCQVFPFCNLAEATEAVES